MFHSEYITIKKIGKYGRTVYIDFNKRRELLKKEEEEKIKKDILSLDYNKPIFLSSKGFSNVSIGEPNEYIFICVTGPEDLLKKLLKLKEDDKCLQYIKIN